MNQKATTVIAEHGITDPSTSESFWKDFLSFKSESTVYQIPDTTIIGIPKKHRWLRKDKTQVLFYGISQQDQWFVHLMPAQTLVLCLFNGKRSLSEIAEVISGVDGCNYKAANLKVRRFLEGMQLGQKDWLQIAPPGVNPTSFKEFDFADFCIPVANAKKSYRLDNPISLMIMPTDKCQTNCVYCYACRRPVPPEELLPIKVIHKLIDEAADLGVSMVNLDGGDMLCRKEIVEIIEHLCERDIHITASTKGYVPKQLARRLYKAGLTYIQVGLDAPTAEEADRLVRRKGFFNHIIETIYNLTDAGITTRTNSIITSSTVGISSELVDFLMTLPLNNIKICPAFRSFFRDGKGIILTHLQKEQLRKTMRACEEKYAGRGINWECSEDVLDMTPQARADRFAQRPICSSARTQCIITPDGKIATCEQSPQDGEFVAGDVKVQSLKEAWDSDKMKRFCCMPREKFKNTPCYECEQFEVCVHDKGQCYMDALKAYGTIYAPSPYCTKAPLPEERWN